jgi:hypothetical protein
MKDNPVIKCAVCKGVLHRIPQPFRFSFNPESIIVDWMDHNYRLFRGDKPGHKKERFSPDHVMRPGKPIPGRQFQSRKEDPIWSQKQKKHKKQPA